MIDITKNLPASLEAIKRQAAMMFSELDTQRAQMFVQQVANKHGDDDVFQMRPEGPFTYRERAKELNEFEENLRSGLPPTVVEAIAQNGKVTD